MKVAPSVLAADFSSIANIVNNVEEWKVDALHMDIMDGEFCPNLTFGPKVVKTFRNLTDIPLYCHLMIIKPERYTEDFLKAGGAVITPHIEAVDSASLKEINKLVKDYDAKLGLAIKIETDLNKIPSNIYEELDEILIMSVPPGFSYQKFNPSILPKIREVFDIVKQKNSKMDIAVDGGVNLKNASLLGEAGVTLLVAGGAIFGEENPQEVVTSLQQIPIREK
ncbi:MAG: ribulose-phosphate 3-epimerase [Candidatus Ranarchaeia archaeon]